MLFDDIDDDHGVAAFWAEEGRMGGGALVSGRI